MTCILYDRSVHKQLFANNVWADERARTQERVQVEVGRVLASERAPGKRQAGACVRTPGAYARCARVRECVSRRTSVSGPAGAARRPLRTAHRLVTLCALSALRETISDWFCFVRRASGREAAEAGAAAVLVRHRRRRCTRDCD